MIEGRDFIFTGLQPWDIAIGSNAKDIALEISKHNRVLYINTPLDKITYYCKKDMPEFTQRKNVVKGKSPAIRQINSSLWVLDYPFTLWPINTLPDGMLFDAVNKLNNKKMYSFVLKTLQELQFKDYILFIDNDIYRSFYAKEYLKPKISIYYRRDNLTSIPFWKKHIERIEPLLIKNSNLIVCNSEQLALYARQFNPKTYDVGQGVDLSSYQIEQTKKQPEDILQIKHPIIGYIGDITSLRLDANLIYKLAVQNPHFSFVLVGKADTVFSAHALNNLKNVHFLGLKPKKQVPNYIQSFDICLNPQLVNDVTIGNYPRKIDEFLALGKPVIATATDTMQLFKDYVYLCHSVDDYQQAIQFALSETDKHIILNRIQFANTHSWKNSVEKIYQSIQNVVKYYPNEL
ncbi:MAG: glycosyltransferase [Tannerellaceae bacterium]